MQFATSLLTTTASQKAKIITQYVAYLCMYVEKYIRFTVCHKKVPTVLRVWRCYMRLLTYLLIDNKLVIETDCSFKMSLAIHNTLNTQSDTRHL